MSDVLNVAMNLSPEQAVSILTEVTADIPLRRADSHAVEAALLVIRQAIWPPAPPVDPDDDEVETFAPEVGVGEPADEPADGVSEDPPDGG